MYKNIIRGTFESTELEETYNNYGYKTQLIKHKYDNG